MFSSFMGLGTSVRATLLVRWGEAIDQWVTDWCPGSGSARHGCVPGTSICTPQGPGGRLHGELRIVGEPGGLGMGASRGLVGGQSPHAPALPGTGDVGCSCTAVWALLLQVVGRARHP